MVIRKSMVLLFSAAMILLIFQKTGHSEIYKYQDESGNWKFTDYNHKGGNQNG